MFIIQDVFMTTDWRSDRIEEQLRIREK